MARWTPTSPAGWRFGWITVVSTCQTTSSSKSGIGGSTPASALSRNRKRTGWRSGGIVRSRSKRSTAESFRTSRPSAPPWPTSWCGTTRPGVSRSLGIKRRSRRARSMSYARRHSTNVCPGNRVRYRKSTQLSARETCESCGRSWPADCGAVCYQCGDRPQKRSTTPDTTPSCFGRVRNCPQCHTQERGHEDTCQHCDWTREAWDARGAT